MSLAIAKAQEVLQGLPLKAVEDVEWTLNKEWKMAQNIISISFTDEERAAIFASIEQLKRLLTPKTTALDVAHRRELCKMGPSSENFCNETLGVLDKNRQVVAPSLGLDEALQDQKALAVVRPALHDLEQLAERLRDTDMALGSDMMDTALEGYRLLKHVGRNQGLDALVDQLGARFARRAKRGLPLPKAELSNA